MHPRLVVLASLAVLPLAAGCGAEPPAASPAKPAGAVRADAPKAFDRVPAPKGEVVLAMSKVAAANRSRGVAAFDKRTLDRLATTEAVVREPFLKRDVRFRGVMIEDLLAIAGAPSDARDVHFHALDDYTIDVTVADLVAAKAMLATRAAGKAIPLAKGGPIRIVFLGDTPTARNTDAWIWSVDAIKLSR